MSLIYIIYSNGPNTDLCGTPARIDYIEEMLISFLFASFRYTFDRQAERLQGPKSQCLLKDKFFFS